MTKVQPPLTSKLENIYISPLELCNLSCLYCYTKKPKTILSNRQILSFVKRYSAAIHKSYFINLKSIIFCGGEVFTLQNFPRLVNNLLKKGIFISIITNGTVDKLDKIHDPQNCQLIVSFDGPEDIHDKNRGKGNFAKSKAFVKKALKLGFPVHINYLVTKDSYPYFQTFRLLDFIDLPITYLTDRLGSLTPDQVREVRNNYPCYPPKNFGCNIFSLQSDGKFYGCCESTISIGDLSQPIKKVIDRYTTVTTKHPLCYDPAFHCQLP